MIFRAVLMTAHYRKVTAAINNSLGQDDTLVFYGQRFACALVVFGKTHIKPDFAIQL